MLCREALNLKATEPIHDICGLIESSGVKIWSLAVASNDFFGLSLGAPDGGPAIIVNVWDRIPVERWMCFSAAHELGHLLLHPHAYDSSVIDEDSAEEKKLINLLVIFLCQTRGS